MRIRSFKGLVKPTSLNIIPSSISVKMGTTYEIPYTLLPENTTNQKINWSSSDTSIATVSNGIITPVAVGTTTITGITDYLGFTDTVSIEVYVVPVAGVTLNESSITVNAGETFQLVATVIPSDAGEQGVTWSSSNTSVATVSSNGLVTYVGSGNCTITVTTVEGGFTATCSVLCKLPIEEYYLLTSGGSTNRYSELTQYGTRSVRNNTSNWQGYVKSTDKYGFHYKVLTKKIVGFEIVFNCNYGGGNYESMNCWLFKDTSGFGSGNIPGIKNCLNMWANSQVYQGAGTGQCGIGANSNGTGTDVIRQTKNNSSTKITYKGELVNGVWNVTISTAAGQSWSGTYTPTSYTNELHGIAVRGGRWFTGTTGYFHSIKVMLME